MNEVNYFPQEQPNSVSSDELYAQTYNEERIKNIIAQISPSNELEEIELRIKGYKKDLYSGKWERIRDTSFSDELVSNFMSSLSVFMNTNVTLGNLSERELAGIMKLLIEFVTDYIDDHADEYGFGTDYSERTRIADIFLYSIFFTLKRSLNGSEARRFWSRLSLNENASMNPINQNKSDWWKFWKK